MKNIDYEKLFAKAEENIAEEKNVGKVNKELIDKEKLEKTEELAESIQELIVDTLTNVKDDTGRIHDYGKLNEYGYPSSSKWVLDDEKFQITIDYSYKISDDVLSYCGPRGFDYSKKISWRYLTELLKEHKIEISREQKTRQEKPKNWIGATYYTDIITITLGRQNKKNSTNSINTTEKQR